MPPVTRDRGDSSCVPEATTARLSVCAFDPGAISLVGGKVPAPALPGASAATPR